MATAADVRELLGPTSLPAELVDQLLDGAPATWLLGEPADVLATDLALCHPALVPQEVRATVSPTTQPASWRLTVVTEDRVGLLAATAGALAFHGLSLTSASAASWPDLGLALQCVTAVDPDGRDLLPGDWDDIGKSLRAALAGTHPVEPSFTPRPPVRVEATPHDQGRCLVTIEAPDKVGLLWAIAHWFESRGCNIDAAQLTTDGGIATGSLLVCGEVDPAALAEAVGGVPAGPWALQSAAVRAAVKGGIALAGIGAAVALRALRAGRKSA